MALKQHIFLFVCEGLVDEFEKSNFQTFNNYCDYLLVNIKNNENKYFINKAIFSVGELLEKVFSFSSKQYSEYILEFLELPNKNDFYLCVKATKTLYKIK